MLLLTVLKLDEAIIKLFRVVHLYKPRLEQFGGDISLQLILKKSYILHRSLIWKLTEADNIYHKHIEISKSNHEVILSFKADIGLPVGS